MHVWLNLFCGAGIGPFLLPSMPLRVVTPHAQLAHSAEGLPECESCMLITHTHTLCCCVPCTGTNNVLLQGNVGFDTHGHCYYFENGVEERNVVDGNLAAFVHPIQTAGSGGGQSVRKLRLRLRLARADLCVSLCASDAAACTKQFVARTSSDTWHTCVA